MPHPKFLDSEGLTYLWSLIVARTDRCPHAVGEVIQLTNSSDPNQLWPGTTWQQMSGVFLLAADQDHALGSTGGASTHTLTTNEMPSHSHGLNSHTHGLNSHTHSVGAHKHGLNDHTHTYDKTSSVTGGSHGHTYGIKFATYYKSLVTVNDQHAGDGLFDLYNNGSYGGTYNSPGKRSGCHRNYGAYSSSDTDVTAETRTVTAATSNTSHSHTVGTTSTNSGKSSGNTANSTAFDTGAASGSTAAASGNTASSGSGTAFSTLPPYEVVNMWKRVS